MLRSRDLFGFWQGLLRVVGSFGDCPRCLAVCPVGDDYHAHLADHQKRIPERTPEKVALGKAYKEARASGVLAVVFAGFSVIYLKEALTLNHAVGFAFIAAGAFFVFRGPL